MSYSCIEWQRIGFLVGMHSLSEEPQTFFLASHTQHTDHLLRSSQYKTSALKSISCPQYHKHCRARPIQHVRRRGRGHLSGLRWRVYLQQQAESSSSRSTLDVPTTSSPSQLSASTSTASRSNAYHPSKASKTITQDQTHCPTHSPWQAQPFLQEIKSSSRKHHRRRRLERCRFPLRSSPSGPSSPLYLIHPTRPPILAFSASALKTIKTQRAPPKSRLPSPPYRSSTFSRSHRGWALSFLSPPRGSPPEKKPLAGVRD
jgi:hypothetical protein